MKALLRLYPAAWRRRYGAEFGEIAVSLLVSTQLGGEEAREIKLTSFFHHAAHQIY